MTSEQQCTCPEPVETERGRCIECGLYRDYSHMNVAKATPSSNPLALRMAMTENSGCGSTPTLKIMFRTTAEMSAAADQIRALAKLPDETTPIIDTRIYQNNEVIVDGVELAKLATVRITGTVHIGSPEEPSTELPASTADQASAPRAGSAVAGGGSEEDFEIDLACESYIEDPHSRFCDTCGYPEREHKRTGSRENGEEKQ